MCAADALGMPAMLNIDALITTNDYLNMFTDRGTATKWTQAHPGVTGEILTHTDAELLGRHIFGDLLT